MNTEETPNERAEEERSQSDDNEHETHQVEPTSREAAIATTEAPQNEERRQWLRKINAVCNFYKKKACRHSMIGEECKFLHPAPCRKYMENPEISCRAPCRGYHPELCKYSRAIRECYNDRCFRIHFKRTRRKQTPPATQEPSTNNSTNHKSATSYDQNTKSGLQPPPTLVNTPHPAYHRNSSCPLTNSLPHPTCYAISHHPSDYRSTVP